MAAERMAWGVILPPPLQYMRVNVSLRMLQYNRSVNYYCHYALRPICLPARLAQVNVEIVQSPVPFPSVTVCNTGHLNMITVDGIEKFFEGEILDTNISTTDEFFDKYSGFQDSTTSFFRHYPDNTTVQERKDNDMIEVSSRLGLVANVGLTLASSVSIRAEDFIVQCQFLARKCNVTQSFIKHFDSYYFNCFTFDPKVNQSKILLNVH